jgi:hypothetical protein
MDSYRQREKLPSMSFKTPYYRIKCGASFSPYSWGIFSRFGKMEMSPALSNYNSALLKALCKTNPLFIAHRILYACKPKNPV